MRKTLLLAALTIAFAAQAVPAHAEHMKAIDGATYLCSYTGPCAPAKNYGYSVFDVNPAMSWEDMQRGIEYFEALRPNGTTYWDNRKFTFAKAVDRYRQGPHDPEPIHFATDWEFTINPSGPQCTFTRVTNSGLNIRFQSCSDGCTRTCTLLWF